MSYVFGLFRCDLYPIETYGYYSYCGGRAMASILQDPFSGVSFEFLRLIGHSCYLTMQTMLAVLLVWLLTLALPRLLLYSYRG